MTSSLTQVDEDLYVAICRSMSTVELTGDANVDHEALFVAARDSLYTLSVAMPKDSFAMIVRLGDKRVLATTCDPDSATNSDDLTSSGSDDVAVDAAAMRGAVVAQLCGERLAVRAPRSLEFLNVIVGSADSTHWFEDGSFELHGGGIRPLEFAACARALVCCHDGAARRASDHTPPFLALMVLSRRASRRRAESTATQPVVPPISMPTVKSSNSLRTLSSTLESPTRSLSSSESDENAQQTLVCEAVQAIDDQYVLACDVDGNVLAGSTIVDALLDRHGANSGRIADSLLGGHQTWVRLLAEQTTELPTCATLSDGTPCKLRISTTIGGLRIVVFEAVGVLRPPPTSMPALYVQVNTAAPLPTLSQCHASSTRKERPTTRASHTRTLSSTLHSKGSSSNTAAGGAADEPSDVFVDDLNSESATSSTLRKYRTKRHKHRDSGARSHVAVDDSGKVSSSAAAAAAVLASSTPPTVPATAISAAAAAGTTMTTTTTITTATTSTEAETSSKFSLTDGSIPSPRDRPKGRMVKSSSSNDMTHASSQQSRPSTTSPRTMSSQQQQQQQQQTSSSSATQLPPPSPQQQSVTSISSSNSNRRPAVPQPSAENSRLTAILSWVRRRADSLPSASITSNTGRIVGGYQLIQEIARGGEGVVFVGTHLESSEAVAVKKRHCNDVRELNTALQEAMTLARVNSEYVVKFYTAFFEELVMEGKQMFELFVVTEYCSGGDLFGKLFHCARDRVTHEHSRAAAVEHSALPLRQWCVQICAAVYALHLVGIVHRDIKLENFVIRENGALCLIDFGISVVYGKGNCVISGTGGHAGSSYYLAPEAFEPKPPRHHAVASIDGAHLAPLLTANANPNTNTNANTNTNTTNASQHSNAAMTSSSLSLSNVSVTTPPTTSTTNPLASISSSSSASSVSFGAVEPLCVTPPHSPMADAVIDARYPKSTTTPSMSASTTVVAAPFASSTVPFAADLWALGIVLLQLTSCHIFQLRKDRMILGKVAHDCGGDATRWRRQLGTFLNDVLPSVPHAVRTIAALLALDRASRLGVQSAIQILSGQGLVLEPPSCNF